VPSLPRVPGFASWPAWLCRLAAAGLILGAAAAHVAYLYHCPLDLAPDEAHYWDWSRHLDWSYYSKGPLVSCLIRGSCELVGDWSQQHTGSLAFAVRLPAVACGSLLLLALYVLTVQVFHREPLALAVVGAALSLPLVSAGSSLMTIDAPYTCCWGWALVLGHRAVFRGSAWAWPMLGLVIGAGILAKYTMVLWVPSLGLFLLTARPYRVLLLRPGFWCMAGVAGLCCLPILVWNIRNDWVSLRHVGALSGAADTAIHWLGPLVYVGQQCALLLGFWFAAWAAAMIVHRPWREADPGVCYLWWLSAPMFLTFLLFSPKTGGGEMNWPVTAYLSGLVLAAAWLGRQLRTPYVRWRRWTALGLALACTLGLLLTGFMHFSDRLYPVLAPLVGPPRGPLDCRIRSVDPTCRLRGWRRLAGEVDWTRDFMTFVEGREPILAGANWTLPGELGVYCKGHPQAYSLGPVTGDRHSQYDLWDSPFTDGERFRGRTFVVVGDLSPELMAAFEVVWPTRWVEHYKRGQRVAVWPITVCTGFRGRFPPPQDLASHY
jgi:4-amino-4-deoxy-L-arabinose transferase-like glycosyltransferase